MNTWEWKYYSESVGDWHNAFTDFYKVKVDKKTKEQIGLPINISYTEYVERK